MENAKVHIIDDDTGLCQSLAYLFESIKIPVQTYYPPSDFLTQYTPVVPGCLLLDVRMPEMSGLSLQDLLQKRKIHLPIIFMSAHADIDITVRAMKNGAFDFFTKPFNHQLLLEAIHKAITYSQENYLKESMCLTFEKLTWQEHQIIEFILSGKSSKEMAALLNLSKKTIEYHRSKIMRKLDLNSLAQLVQYYLYYQEHFKNH